MGMCQTQKKRHQSVKYQLQCTIGEGIDLIWMALGSIGKGSGPPKSHLRVFFCHLKSSNVKNFKAFRLSHSL